MANMHYIHVLFYMCLGSPIEMFCIVASAENDNVLVTNTIKVESVGPGHLVCPWKTNRKLVNTLNCWWNTLMADHSSGGKLSHTASIAVKLPDRHQRLHSIKEIAVVAKEDSACLNSVFPCHWSPVSYRSCSTYILQWWCYCGCGHLPSTNMNLNEFSTLCVSVCVFMRGFFKNILTTPHEGNATLTYLTSQF